MSTENTLPNTAAQQLIDQRLDAIDRALLGLLPRNDRLAMVAQVETRIRELAAANPAVEANLTGSTEGMLMTMPQALVPSAAGTLPSTCRKRSRLALSAGVLGIMATVLLFVTPVMYLLAGFLGDGLGEIAAYSILGTHLAALTISGAGAVALAIAALVNLKRRKESLTGHGWAFTGLCTGPLPMFAGGATALFFGFQLLASQTMSVQAASTDDAVPVECSGPFDESDRMPPPDAIAPIRVRASDLDGAAAVQPATEAGPGQSQIQPAGVERPAGPVVQPDAGEFTLPSPESLR